MIKTSLLILKGLCLSVRDRLSSLPVWVTWGFRSTPDSLSLQIAASSAALLIGGAVTNPYILMITTMLCAALGVFVFFSFSLPTLKKERLFPEFSDFGFLQKLKERGQQG